MELPDKIYEEVDILSTAGNDLMDDEHFDAAIEKWTQAIGLLPEPKADWEAYMWLSASIGDAEYQKERFELARNAFLDALNAPGGVERLGLYVNQWKTSELRFKANHTNGQGRP
ncbi:TPA: tetratricopeptide repeat protein [Pseudomonas aeruginosa]